MSVKKHLADVSAAMKGHTSNSPIEGSPSRPLEFLPVVLDVNYSSEEGEAILGDINKSECVIEIAIDDLMNGFGGTFGYMKDGRLYTNMRACINAGIPYDKVPYNTKEQLANFKAIRAKIPMFVWAQVPNTHTAISKEAASDRMITTDEYWMPDDFIERVRKDAKRDCKTLSVNDNRYYHMSNIIACFSDMSDVVKILIHGTNTTKFSQAEVIGYFKYLGYKKEIYNRAMYYFKYKEVVMTGWNNNPKVWGHLVIERNAEPTIWKNWTQEQSKLFVEAIRKMVF